ncbi:MAG TPA: LytTR family DNA-binding domain-containing protein [Hymenobacter sp.]|uniref:LytR/AlgR family response regulator transcription factor n=1 Tax=Hymenobacter sp. TaxID=1898978 RepID=UPI002D7EF2EB|nr:LytTR family DNA-binding domain-containing protein [Hymenobacter sp.]HET9502290.1 LytTR family DNA-binding domain-containing protein [Hymenobacter sp.]
MTILLLEDEDPAAARLRQLLAQAAPEARVLAVLDTVAGALAWLAAHPAPDLILSDIQLADGLSFDVFTRAVVRSPVIFTTAYDQYAIRAFEANSIAYLLKPVKLPELAKALAKWRQWPAGPAGSEEVGVKSEELTVLRTAPEAVGEAAQAESEKLRLLSTELLAMLTQNLELKTQNSTYKARFLVRQGEALLPLPAAEAAWFQSRHETTTLATFDGRRFVVDYTLEQLEALLDPAQFFRLTRQVLAQLPAVRRLVPHLGGKLLAELSPALPTGTEALVSKEKAAPLRRWLEGLA